MPRHGSRIFFYLAASYCWCQFGTPVRAASWRSRNPRPLLKCVPCRRNAFFFGQPVLASSRGLTKRKGLGCTHFYFADKGAPKPEPMQREAESAWLGNLPPETDPGPKHNHSAAGATSPNERISDYAYKRETAIYIYSIL